CEEEILHKWNRYLFEELSQDNDSEDSYYWITTIDMTTVTDMTTADIITTTTGTTNFTARDKPAKLEAYLVNEYTLYSDVWIMARISFSVIENPFIQDMFKEFQPGYHLPSRNILLGRLLDEELAWLSFSDQELTDLDLQDGCNITSIGNIISYDEADQIRVSEGSLLDNNSSDSLLIEKIVDLSTEYFKEGHSETFVATQIQNVQNISSSDLDYDPSDILSSFFRMGKTEEK
ncbi:11310_t:CDS:2, partial [Ambispora leptoticha]